MTYVEQFELKKDFFSFPLLFYSLMYTKYLFYFRSKEPSGEIQI
jgi:hypothetical protein